MLNILRGQAAVDFLSSYGIAFFVIFIAVAVIYKTAILNPTTIPPTCTPFPGFTCSQYSLNASSGAISFTFAQATGGNINVNGFACSSAKNVSNDIPQYGNVHVTNQLKYYPVLSDPSNTAYPTLPSTTSETLNMYCYGPGGVSKGRIGNAFFGYIYLNYTIPGYGRITQEIASVTAKYT
ncbi:MAG: hypothetical protein KGH59_01095 [Candidatus Micrarchaeota archaeon]|nr:hypothetical protein [Candidatus Micrarchaeota archaeon]MDE1804364.1 hypothetical protein [Candidatus Micrarchaeota archaeon]MDE1846608.1 hypothetical protein [Candidatus Micrarchaeota archaeon]